jgi:predicted RNase H-like HicB family nuclease
MKKKCFMDVVVNKERLSSGKPVYVSHYPSLGIASQGKTTEEALTNTKEAIELYLESDTNDLAEYSGEQSHCQCLMKLPTLSGIDAIRNFLRIFAQNNAEPVVEVAVFEKYESGKKHG